LVRVDALVALVYNVDPAEAQIGVPAKDARAAVHPDDRERVHALVERSAQEGRAYLIEHREWSWPMGKTGGCWCVAASAATMLEDH
jgi:hypothetical protein